MSISLNVKEMCNLMIRTAILHMLTVGYGLVSMANSIEVLKTHPGDCRVQLGYPIDIKWQLNPSFVHNVTRYNVYLIENGRPNDIIEVRYTSTGVPNEHIESSLALKYRNYNADGWLGLTLLHTDMEDAGKVFKLVVYVTGHLPEADQNSLVIVQRQPSRPVIVQTLPADNRSVVEGKLLILDCMSESQTIPNNKGTHIEYHWKRLIQGVPEELNGEQTESINENTGSKLVVPNISGRISGYRCIATESGTELKSHLDKNFAIILKDTTTPPTIALDPTTTVRASTHAVTQKEEGTTEPSTTGGFSEQPSHQSSKQPADYSWIYTYLVPAIGGVVLIIVITTFVVCCKKRKRRNDAARSALKRPDTLSQMNNGNSNRYSKNIKDRHSSEIYSEIPDDPDEEEEDIGRVLDTLGRPLPPRPTSGAPLPKNPDYNKDFYVQPNITNPVEIDMTQYGNRIDTDMVQARRNIELATHQESVPLAQEAQHTYLDLAESESESGGPRTEITVMK